MQQNELQPPNRRPRVTKWLILLVAIVLLSATFLIATFVIWINKDPSGKILSPLTGTAGILLALLGLLMPLIQKAWRSHKKATAEPPPTTTDHLSLLMLPASSSQQSQEAQAPLTTPAPESSSRTPVLVTASPQAAQKPHQKPQKTKLPPTPVPDVLPSPEEMNLSHTPGRGGIIVWQSARCSYSTLHISIGHRGMPTKFKSTNLQQSGPYKRAIFQALTPNDYTVFAIDPTTHEPIIIEFVVVEPYNPNDGSCKDYVIVDKRRGTRKL